MLLFILSCSPCKKALLPNIQSLEDLEDCCSLPKRRAKMWTCDTPPPQDRSIRSLRKLHQACDLEDLTDINHFSMNKGDAIRAAQIYFWLKKNRISEASRLAKLALGDREFPSDIPLIVIQDVPASAVTSTKGIEVILEEIQDRGMWGSFPYWHRQEKNSNFIAIAPQVSLQSLRYALASRENQEEPLKVLALAKEPTAIQIHPPYAKNVEHLHKEKGEWIPKTESEYVRLYTTPEDQIADVLSAIASMPTRTVELAMEHQPCATPPTGMLCIEGNKEHTTFYIDRESQDDTQACREAGVCTAPQGTWLAAHQQCLFRGKRLPRKSEVRGVP